ncbi:LysR substrate-binding domain-containing protein [Desulfovibrio ferrophilus]|uniref:Transcriptional regulator, LysR family n=1 Tax=Desulfovibrio ferrophilus TaxID=241368 RepID=A0A2Z6AWG3_9BACT|nr:LysR substrate-binding domain-containing protein [Desulfovibrio ferrophilus]BBD07535.1 transcriptional regulator, LysR family [Desulfovibrio ferrophilus]
MDLRQLRHFLAVAKALHFGKAAIQLHISQPPLSQSIRKLEDELGARLFERTSRSVSLTAAGKYLQEEAQAILDRTTAVAKHVEQMGQGKEGQLTIGTIGPVLEGPLPYSLRHFKEKNPHVDISLQQLTTRNQLQALLRQELDVGFVRPFNTIDSRLSHTRYARESYVMAIPEGHPLAKNSTLSLKEIANETLLIFPRPTNTGLYDAIITCLHRAGATPKLLHTALLKHPTGALVAAGLGFSLMPESLAAIPRPGVVHLPIKDKLPIVEYHLVWTKNNSSRLVQRFVEAMLEKTTIQQVDC